jgi:hypothetical protein
MLKGKNLWILLGVGAVAYYYWMQKKKKDTTSAPSVAFTGDLGVPEYQNAGGRFVKTRIPYGSQFNRAVDKFSGQEYYIPR